MISIKSGLQNEYAFKPVCKLVDSVYSVKCDV